MKQLISVFVSSTSDLKKERRAIAKAFREDGNLRHCAAYFYEEDRARSETPQRRVKAVIEESELFLGVCGKRYGSRLSGTDGRSICEWEFDQARAAGDIQILMMLSETDDSIEPAQKRFRDRIEHFQAGVWRKTYGSARELIDEVTESVVAWLAEFFIQQQQRKAQSYHRIKKLTLSLAGLGLALAVSTVVSNMIYPLSITQIVSVIGLSIAIILMAWIIHTVET